MIIYSKGQKKNCMAIIGETRKYYYDRPNDKYEYF